MGPFILLLNYSKLSILFNSFQGSSLYHAFLWLSAQTFPHLHGSPTLQLSNSLLSCIKLSLPPPAPPNPSAAASHVPGKPDWFTGQFFPLPCPGLYISCCEGAPLHYNQAAYFANCSPEFLILACIQTAGRRGSADLTALTLWNHTAHDKQERTVSLSLSLSEFDLGYISFCLAPYKTHSFSFHLTELQRCTMGFGCNDPDLCPPPSSRSLSSTPTPPPPLLNLHPTSHNFSSYFQWII